MPRPPAAHIASSRIVALRLASPAGPSSCAIFSSDSQTLLTRFDAIPQSTRNQQEYRTRGVMNLSVYRREGEPGLCCAVAADEPVPAFVGGGPGLHDVALLDRHAPPQAFDPRAAGEALRSMVFYMFH